MKFIILFLCSIIISSQSVAVEGVSNSALDYVSFEKTCKMKCEVLIKVDNVVVSEELSRDNNRITLSVPIIKMSLLDVAKAKMVVIFEDGSSEITGISQIRFE